MSKNKKIPAFRMRKDYLTGLASWLHTIPLNGRQSRLRTRFVSELAQSIQMTEKERIGIVGKYVDKETNEAGHEVWKKDLESNNFVVSPEKQAYLQKEINDLYHEHFVMNLTPETEENIKAVKDIVFNTDYKFGLTGEEKTEQEKNQKLSEVSAYNVWCEAFEVVENL